MTEKMLDQHIAWSRKLYDSLEEGGVWGVPRSGLIFEKRDGALVLIEACPWMEGMPITAEEVLAQQAAEFQQIREHFEAAGIPVRGDEEEEEL